MKFVLSAAFSPLGDLPALARAADQHQWQAMSFSDHVVNPETITTPYPYTEDGSRRWQAFTDWPDPWVSIGALASITERLRFTNNVFVLPMRNPFLVAKAVGTAAILSQNRVTLTIGVGWSRDEYLLMQQDFHTRGKRCDEMITIMKKLWTGEMVQHQGQYYQFEPLEMNPAPTQSIPIWVGGISDAALRRAARLGDGWLSDLQSSQEICDCVAKIHAYRREYGRDHLPFEVMASPNDAFEYNGYKKLEDQGVSHILTMPWHIYYGEQANLAEKQQAIARFADDVISKMT
jgi:probable F420-dependent oxidoreductase